MALPFSISANAKPLARSRPGDCAYDVFSPVTETVKPGEFKQILLNLTIRLPSNCFAWLTSRSGLASTGIIVVGGIIDPNFTHNIVLIIANLSQSEFTVQKHMKIAQLIIIPFLSLVPIPVESQSDLPEQPTDRLDNCLGSSGLF